MNDVPKNSNNEPRDAFASQLNNKQPRGKKSWLKTVGIFIVLVAIGLGLFFKFTQYGRNLFQIAKIAPKLIEVHQNPTLLFDNVNSDIVNILLIGRDVNYKIIFKHGKPIAHVYDENTPARADSMILLSLNKDKRTLRMISLPRDSMVHMPPNKYNVHTAKLNAAHAYGGPAMLEQAIHDDLGITVNRYAVIRFSGFEKLVEQVGGVDVDVIGALYRGGKRGDLNYDDNWGNLHIHLKPGMQHLNGKDAHDYVRFREDMEGDPGRIRRQQQVLRALGKKLTEQPIYKIPGLVQEVRQQFKTDMSDQEIASAAYFVRSLGPAAHMHPVTLFGIYAERGNVILNKPKNIKLLSYLLGSTFDAATFLQNSPSTDRDELGPENDSNPEAKELLRAAGLLASSSSASSDNNVSSESKPHRRSKREPVARPLSTPTEAPIEHSRRSKSRVADSSIRRTTSRKKPTRGLQTLSVDDSSPSTRSSAPIRHDSPKRHELSESSPVPRPE
ncbi:MAG: LCP family protein [Abditibacteriaceae bacterium]